MKKNNQDSWEGKIKVDPNLSVDEILEKIGNNKIFQEDLRIIGGIGHEKRIVVS